MYTPVINTRLQRTSGQSVSADLWKVARKTAAASRPAPLLSITFCPCLQLQIIHYECTRSTELSILSPGDDRAVSAFAQLYRGTPTLRTPEKQRVAWETIIYRDISSVRRETKEIRGNVNWKETKGHRRSIGGKYEECTIHARPRSVRLFASHWTHPNEHNVSSPAWTLGLASTVHQIQRLSLLPCETHFHYITISYQESYRIFSATTQARRFLLLDWTFDESLDCQFLNLCILRLFVE